jgi:hypothetical protein
MRFRQSRDDRGALPSTNRREGLGVVRPEALVGTAVQRQWFRRAFGVGDGGVRVVNFDQAGPSEDGAGSAGP